MSGAIAQRIPATIASITREEYDRWPGVNYSSLKEMAKSPAHYRHRLMEAREDNAALKNGRCVHMAVFEPERFASEVVVWRGGRRAGKEWEKFAAEYSESEILTEAEHEQCVNLQRAIRADSRCRQYLEHGRTEVSVQWTHSEPAIGGLPGLTVGCKGRMDYVTSTHIVDLKSTRSAEPAAFGRACANYLYHVQAAMYLDGWYAATGQRLQYVLIAAEMSPPCVVQPFVIPEYLIEHGRQTYRAWLSRLDECRRTDVWPGYADGELELLLPRWSGVEVPDEDDGLAEDLGLAMEAN